MSAEVRSGEPRRYTVLTSMTTSTLPLFIELFGGGQGLLLLIVWLCSPARYGWAGRFLTLLLASASTLLFWLALHDSRLLVYTPDLIGLGPTVSVGSVVIRVFAGVNSFIVSLAGRVWVAQFAVFVGTAGPSTLLQQTLRRKASVYPEPLSPCSFRLLGPVATGSFSAVWIPIMAFPESLRHDAENWLLQYRRLPPDLVSATQPDIGSWLRTVYPDLHHSGAASGWFGVGPLAHTGSCIWLATGSYASPPCSMLFRSLSQPSQSRPARSRPSSAPSPNTRSPVFLQIPVRHMPGN